MSSIVENLVPNGAVLAAQAGIYLSSLVVINYLIVKPLSRLQKERAKRTTEKSQLAVNIHSQADELQLSYDEKMRKALTDARHSRNSAVQEGHAAAQKFVLAAQNEARERINSSKNEIAALTEAERKKLPELAKGASEILLNKLLQGNNIALFILAFLPMLFSEKVQAAEAAGAITLDNTGYPIFQFIIFIVLLYFAGKNTIATMLGSKREKLKVELETARNELIVAKNRVQELEDKLQKSEKEIATMLIQFKEEGEKERQNIIEEGQKVAAQVKADAERVAQVSLSQAQFQLKRELINLILEMTKEKITPASLDKIEENLRKDAQESISKIVL